MLTAHLPSGYIAAKLIKSPIPFLWPAALLGAVFPDFDMIWFHFIDQGRIHHHRYWVHIPLFWVSFLSLCLIFFYKSRWLQTILVFHLLIFVHLILDSVGGGILWGIPFSDQLFSLTEVPATRSHWVWSFVFHWSFLLELMIWGVAILLWSRAKIL